MLALRTSRHTHREELRRTWLFSECSDRELDAISALCVPIDVDPGRILARSGERCAEVIVVVAGQAAVERGAALIGHLGPGAAIGTLGLVDATAARETVTAETGMTLLVLSVRELKGFLATGRGRSIQHRLDVVGIERQRRADAEPCDPELLRAWGL